MLKGELARLEAKVGKLTTGGKTSKEMKKMQIELNSTKERCKSLENELNQVNSIQQTNFANAIEG